MADLAKQTLDHDWAGRDRFARDAVTWLSRWISYNSVSDRSNDSINQDVADVLQSIGFKVTWNRYVDRSGVAKSNLIAQRGSHDSTGRTDRPGLAYFCHTDVVPVPHWDGPPAAPQPADSDHPADSDSGTPFEAVETPDRIYGRGSCDMKGSLAAMAAAAASVPATEAQAPLWLVCTADEEVGFMGARHLAAQSSEYRDIVHADPIAIIGEPTELQVVHAHKGIAVYRMVSEGRAAHSSTDEGINANTAMIPVLNELERIRKETLEDASWHHPHFDPPHLSWTYGVSDSMSVSNITPGRSVAWVSLRTMPDVDHRPLIARLREVAERSGVRFETRHEGQPVWIDPDASHIHEMATCMGTPSQSVCYATDGGELSELSRRLILGPGSIRQAHTSDEFIDLDQLRGGIDVYRHMILRYC